ncbi:MAG TPA: PDZ domain-containing protein, partial [Planctomycetota bacterium]|nr:PDZ domain-containing protein [Planctomycetota bacterium]
MNRFRTATVLLLGAGLVGTGAVFAPRLLQGEDETKLAEVQRAIDRVYPALVQIHVLELEHDGGHERKQEAAGSGAIISTDGYVVTNHHVAGKACTIRVILSSKEELPATLVGTDALADIAIVKLDLSARAKGSPELPVAKWGRAEKLKVGDPVLAMGCPRALSHSVTKGIVANKEMMMPRFVGSSNFMLDGEDVGSIVKWIGHDATIQPGNSGGPLVNLDGEIIGINEIGIGTMAGAIPSEIASAVAQEIIAHGRVRRSWTGIGFQAMLKTEAPDAPGVLIANVVPGSPADKAGVKAGDVLLSVDGTNVRAHYREELPELNMLLLSRPVGGEMKLKLRRADGETTVSLKSDLRDDAEGKERESKPWGITAREITTMVAAELQRPDTHGVMVGSVRAGGPCDQAQPALRAGDVIVEVAGKPVSNLDGFLDATTTITAEHSDPVPTLVAFERGTMRLLSLVEVGVKKPQEPTPEAKRAWIGLETQVLSKKLAAALNMKGKKGVRISEVYPDTAAEKAGFQVGDVITHVGDQVVEASEPHDADVFYEMVRQYKVGSEAEFTVVRGGQKVTVTATLEAAPKPERELKEYEDTVLEFKARDVS